MNFWWCVFIAVECCRPEECVEVFGVNSYCEYRTYVNSTKCSVPRTKRDVIFTSTPLTTENFLEGIAGLCDCRILYTMVNGRCISIYGESEETTRPPTTTDSMYGEHLEGTTEEFLTDESTESTTTQAPCVRGTTVEGFEGVTCRSLGLNDAPAYITEETTPTVTGTDPIVTTTASSICYNWICTGQNCTGRQADTCVNTGNSCFSAKHCLEVDYEYIFSCTDPCTNGASVSQDNCYSVLCTTPGCNNDTSVVNEYTCFTSAGGFVSVTGIAIGLVFILPNMWIFISPL